MKKGKKKTKKKEKFGNKKMFMLAAFTAVISLGTALLLLSFMLTEETEPTPITSHLIEFYGRECPHCSKMVPIIEEVEGELGISFSRLEVWHNSGNEGIFNTYSEAISEACGGGLGVPAFYNTKTGKALCGEASKDELIEWASGD
ncbi:MAG: hypothetical protein ABIG39_06095 [Candidatus Micrarchaeota archaeon]